MTKAPEFNAFTDLIEVHFDGLFVDKSHGKSDVASNTKWQPRVAGEQREQILIDESVANSFLYALSDQFMPYKMEKPSLTSQLTMMLPELKYKYGQDV
jgi:hypothetical protein